MLARCSFETNQISIRNLETDEEHVSFQGAQLRRRAEETIGGDTHVREIPNTNLLVSLNHSYERQIANMEVFDISKKGEARKIYSLGRALGWVGMGDSTYNSRRNILGAVPFCGRLNEDKCAYLLFNINANASNPNEIVKLNRRSRWHSQYTKEDDNHVTGLDFNPAGEAVTTIDYYGMVLFSDIDIDNCWLDSTMRGSDKDTVGRCRWTTNAGDDSLFIKYSRTKLDVVDVIKKKFLMEPLELDGSVTTSIDVCQVDGNLLVSGGSDKNIKLFDKRESKIVKIFDGIHSEIINCVRWSPDGDMIASASEDQTAKVLDFKTGKVIYTGKSSDESK